MKKLVLKIILIFLTIPSFGQMIISSNTTWTTNRTLTQPVVVNEGVTLTINPGVIVSVLYIDNNTDSIGDVSLNVKGTLIVKGGVCNKVQFKPFVNTTSKQYWTGIIFDSLSKKNEIRETMISNSKNGIIVNNSELLINSLEIKDCKSTGIYITGNLAKLNLNNALIYNCNEEGIKILNGSECEITYLKSRNNGTSGLFSSSSKLKVSNSVFFKNKKSGIYLFESSLNIKNTISRKNTKMGISINNSDLYADYIDVDSNLFDGIFSGGKSKLKITNSSITANLGFGIETTEYVFGVDYGSLYKTTFNPNVNINKSNFISNHKTFIEIDTDSIPGLIFPYAVGDFSASNTDVYGNPTQPDAIYKGTYTPLPFIYQWSPFDPNSVKNFYDWVNLVSIEVPFGFFNGFDGDVGRIGGYACGTDPLRPKYALFEQGTTTPFWFTDTPKDKQNGYRGINVDVKALANKDIIIFSGGLNGTGCGGPYSFSRESRNIPIVYRIDGLKYKVGGYQYKSLINQKNVVDSLLENYWDTIVPSSLINSVGATLNINGYEVSEISASHSSLPTDYIYSNKVFFVIDKNKPVFCKNDKNLLIGPSGNYSYSWFKDNILLNNTNDTLEINTDGNYSLSISGVCSITSLNQTIEILTGNSVEINILGSTTFCQGQSVVLKSPSASGNLWSNGETTESITVKNSGDYSLTILNDNNCASNSKPIKISTIDLPKSAESILGETKVCQGQISKLYTTPIIENATSYFWTLPNGFNGTSSTNNINVSFNNTAISGSIIVKGINSCGEGAPYSLKIEVNSLPDVTITASKTSVCSGDNVILTGGGASTYTWDNNVSNGVSFVPTSTKAYTVTGTDVNGCTKTASIIVAVNSLPIVSASATKTAVCLGDNVTLTATGASTYVWDNNVSNGQSFVPPTTKTYTVTGTDANGCTKTATISVAVNSLPAVSASATKTAVCLGDNVTLTGSGASTYVWDNNVSNGVSFVPTSTKTYTVIGTDANGCSKSANINLVVNSPNVVANASKTAVCSGENVTLTATGASNYAWDNNVSNGVSFVPSTTKTYTVIGTDANGCTKTATISVTVNNLPTVSASATKTSVCSGDNVTLTGGGASTYVWDNNVSNGVSFAPSTTKTYIVIGTDANGCTKTATISVAVNSLPSVSVTATKTTLCLGDNVTLTGSGASTYVWDNNVINGVTFVPTTTKTYTVTGTDVNGCTKTATISVAVNSLPSVSASTTKTTVCLGENVTLTGSGASTYVWDNNVSNGISFVPSTTKTYTVTGTDVNGCIKTATISVVVNNLPTVIANTSKTTVCIGDNVILSGSGASTYAWDNNVGNGVSFVPSTTKTYTVTGTDANGCTKTATISVAVNSLPAVSASATKTAVCLGDNVTLTGSGASTYVWDNNVSNGVSFVPTSTKTYTVIGTDANGCSKSANINLVVNSPNVVANASKTALCLGENVTLTATGASTYAWDNNVSNGVSFVPSTTKTYTVTGTDANGCTKTATISVAVNSLPTVSASATKTAVCLGDNVTLTGGGASTYTWDNNVSNGESFVPTTTKTYTVTGTDVNGCTKTATINVAVNSLPTVSASATKTAVCLGDNVILTGSGAMTYVWDNNVSNGASFVPTATKTYTVTGTDVNGCTKTATISVAVNNLPTVSASATKTAVCLGDNVILTGSGAMTYVWDNNVSNVTSFVPTATKTYTVIGTDANGCTKTATISVSVNSLPTVTASASKTAVCSGDNVTLTGSGASTYTWDNNVSNGVSFVPTSTKTYTVTGTDANGCSKTAMISVALNSLPSVVISANGNTTSCKDGGLELLTSNTGISYLWSSGEISSNIYPTESGVYSLKLKDINGCEGISNSIKVTINPLPVVTVSTNGPVTYCTTKLTELVASNGVSYLWNDGSTTKTIKPTQSGSYYVKLTDINGCSASSEPIYLTVNDCASLDNLSDKNVLLYPNPINDILKVELPAEYVNAKFKVIDVSGKELVNGNLNTTMNTINLESLASGTYFLEIGNEYKTKFIKQ